MPWRASYGWGLGGSGSGALPGTAAAWRHDAGRLLLGPRGMGQCLPSLVATARAPPRDAGDRRRRHCSALRPCRGGELPIPPRGALSRWSSPLSRSRRQGLLGPGDDGHATRAYSFPHLSSRGAMVPFSVPPRSTPRSVAWAGVFAGASPPPPPPPLLLRGSPNRRWQRRVLPTATAAARRPAACRLDGSTSAAVDCCLVRGT